MLKVTPLNFIKLNHIGMLIKIIRLKKVTEIHDSPDAKIELHVVDFSQLHLLPMKVPFSLDSNYVPLLSIPPAKI